MGAVRPAQVMDEAACASGGGEGRNNGGPLTLGCNTRKLPLHRRLDVFLTHIRWQAVSFIRRLSSTCRGQRFVGLYLSVMSNADIPQSYLDMHSTVASGQEGGLS
jgi:hypothetical protein